MRVSARDRPLVIAHRGSSGTAPENTMAAFREAASSGAGMIELDVRLTRDLECVVLHDRTLRRTTGARGRVWEATLDDIRGLDAGSWFEARFRGERVPRLQEVMAWLPGSMGLNIEIKTDGDPRPPRVIAEACVSAIREGTGAGRYLVSSFDGRVLRYLHRLIPGLPTGELYVPSRGGPERTPPFTRGSTDRAFICSRAQLRRHLARDAHRHGRQLFCYVINNARHLARALAYGVDGVITDYPARLCRLLET